MAAYLEQPLTNRNKWLDAHVPRHISHDWHSLENVSPNFWQWQIKRHKCRDVVSGTKVSAEFPHSNNMPTCRTPKQLQPNHFNHFNHFPILQVSQLHPQLLTVPACRGQLCQLNIALLQQFAQAMQALILLRELGILPIREANGGSEVNSCQSV